MKSLQVSAPGLSPRGSHPFLGAKVLAVLKGFALTEGLAIEALGNREAVQEEEGRGLGL